MNHIVELKLLERNTIEQKIITCSVYNASFDARHVQILLHALMDHYQVDKVDPAIVSSLTTPLHLMHFQMLVHTMYQALGS